VAARRLPTGSRKTTYAYSHQTRHRPDRGKPHFDHVFATYVPKSHDSVSNLLSKGIITADGKPGAHLSKAAQFERLPHSRKILITLDKDEKAPYQILPSPSLNFSPRQRSFRPARQPTFGSRRTIVGAGDEFLLTTGAATGFSQTFVQPIQTRGSIISMRSRTGRSS